MKETALFSAHEIRGVTFKNRIVMSPMDMSSSFTKDGTVNDWHLVHYGSRAIGQVGLIIIETSSVSSTGFTSDQELGIWNDFHIEGLKKLTKTVHELDSKVGIQLGHKGVKVMNQEKAIAPSKIEYGDTTSEEMTLSEIERVIKQFKDAAIRAKAANFDVIEIHAAHGYLIHEFLSPLTNHRTDAYGGSVSNRFKFLEEIIVSIRSIWDGPLFVRISANEYSQQGNDLNNYVIYSKMMKELGVDLIDCSSGGLNTEKIIVYPGYQVPLSETIKKNANIQTGAVGMITSGLQAEEILQNNRADLVFIGRALLRNPYWPLQAALELGVTIPAPEQYHGRFGARWF